MIKILFTVCNHGDEQVGKYLFEKYPYGYTNDIEWKVIFANPEAMMLNERYIDEDLNRVFPGKRDGNYEERRAYVLTKLFSEYDVLYDVHQTYPHTVMDNCLFVNDLNDDVIKNIDYCNALHVIWDHEETFQRQYLTGHHPIGITLEYAKTGDHRKDCLILEKDFLNIVSRKKVQKQKTYYQAHRGVTYEEIGTYKLKNFVKLTEKEKDMLRIAEKGDFYPVFICDDNRDPYYYCFLNKKLTRETSMRRSI